MNVEKLVEIYYAVDEFLIRFMPYMEKQLLTNSKRKPTRICSLNLSEIMTILIAFHVIGFRNFKSYYLHLQQFHSNDFGQLVSYSRFISLIQRTPLFLFIFLQKALPKLKRAVTLWIQRLLRFVTFKDPMLTRFLNQLLLKEKPAPVVFWIQITLDSQRLRRNYELSTDYR